MAHRKKRPDPERAALVALLATLAACGGTDPYGDIYEPCTPLSIRCRDGASQRCNPAGRGWEEAVVCEDPTPLCASGVGCVSCIPGERRCQGAVVQTCDEAGLHWVFEQSCSEEEYCYEGRCGGDCARAGALRSYEGCEYLAVTMMNSELAADFTPAIVVSNRNDDAITVTVSRSGAVVAEATVEPRALGTVELPWVEELKGDGSGDSQNLDGGAYRVVTSLPATVYQFNPLDYALPRDCTTDDPIPGDGRCFSYTNDASLLLPVQVLTEHYIVMSRPSLGIQVSAEGLPEREHLFSPSVLAIANPQTSPVTVEVRLSAATSGGRGIFSHDAGETATFSIDPEGVLQLAAATPTSCEPDWVEPDTFPCGVDLECRYGYCDLGDRDLTGTEISASAPVAVFGGHDCDFIPYNRWACDHLEEQLFPYETWGRRFVVQQSHRERGEPDLYRVLSGGDGVEVTFDPAEVHAPVVLDRGGFVELEAVGPFELSGSGPLLVGQFLVGQSYAGFTETELPPGDPSFALVVPVEQHRGAYNFLAPESFDRSFVNVTAEVDTAPTIALDGESLAGEAWEAVGEGDHLALRLEIEAGSHVISSEEGLPFGIAVYGYGQYTSYMYPGGLDLQPIAVW